MNFEYLKDFLSFQTKPDNFYPDFQVGDLVAVHHFVSGTKKKRIQIFKGLVIAITGSLNSKAFSVHRVVSGLAVRKKFFYNSPLVTKVEVVQKGRVRRSKIYYICNLKGKAARIKRAK